MSYQQTLWEEVKDVINPKILSKQNIVDRFYFLTNNENDLFSYNLDKKLFMLKFLNI